MDQQDELLCKEVAKTKDLTLAAMNLYSFDNKDIAAAFMNGKLKSAEFKNRIQELLDKQGLSIYKANSKLKQLLEAKKSIFNGGEVIKTEDSIVQAKALEILYKLHKQIGGIDTKNIENQYNVVISNNDLNSLNKSLGTFKELQDQLTKQGKPAGEIIDIEPNSAERKVET